MDDNENLSVARVIGWDIQDVSVIISRTFFYETLCGQSENPDDWHHRFSFIFGEGFGETGGIFHQIPYAKEVRNYGFTSKVYGDFRNSRQIADLLHIYTSSNYIEYLGHGDWRLERDGSGQVRSKLVIHCQANSAYHHGKRHLQRPH